MAAMQERNARFERAVESGPMVPVTRFVTTKVTTRDVFVTITTRGRQASSKPAAMRTNVSPA
jgi:hypothetical protein